MYTIIDSTQHTKIIKSLPDMTIFLPIDKITVPV